MRSRGCIAALRMAAVAAIGVAGFAARPTRAQDAEAGEAVHLAYASAPGCPSRESFEAGVRARTARAAFVGAAGAVRTFEVEVFEGRPSRGRFEVWSHGAVQGAREVTAETCTDVADALALAVALAIDPSAALAPPSPAAPSAAGSADEPGPGVAVSPVPAARPTSAPVLVSSALPREAAAHPTRASFSPHDIFFSAEAAFATGVAPATLVAFSPRVGWRGPTLRPIGWAASAAFVRASSGTLELSGAQTSFEWTVGRGDVCAVAWPGGRLHAAGCVRIEAGQLRGAASQIAGALTRDRPWLATGLVLRVEWELLPPLFVTADVGGMLHATDDRFYLLPDATADAVPLFGVEASAGVAAHFL